jgi:ABC-2 type transport system ATP-binding protein
MRVFDYLRFRAGIKGVPRRKRRTRIHEAALRCGVTEVLSQTIRTLSKGFRQRTGLAQALIHDPDILILDEPTSGLDPLQILGIRDLIKSLAGNKTIIFSTHILQEVRPVTDRVVIINEGRIIADGDIGELSRRAMGTNRVYLGLRTDTETAERALGELENVASIQPLAAESEGTCRFEVRADFDQDLTGELVRLAAERGWELTELHETPFSLEDTFIALTQRANGRKEVA